MLKLIVQIEEKMKQLEELTQNKDIQEQKLLPRRKEILSIIRNHEFISSEALRRRFLKISPRMIRYDLKNLEKEGFILKIGSTRGVVYKIK